MIINSIKEFNFSLFFFKVNTFRIFMNKKMRVGGGYKG